MNYLSFADENGIIVGTVPVDTRGGTVRVAVGEPGRSSGVWRIWANPTKSDVYIAARNLAGVQKFSLHESGRWRYAFVEGAKVELPESADRALDKVAAASCERWDDRRRRH